MKSLRRNDPPKRRTPFAAVLLAAALLAASGGWRAAAAAAPAARPTAETSRPGLFGTREIRADSIGLFPKWTGALARYFDERRLAAGGCVPGPLNRCLLARWQRFLDGLRGRDPLAQIVAVNDEMNRRRYVIDPRNYGVPDYWAAPGQFLARDGDCEDYAIAKFMSLRALGFANAKLRVVVLQDLNLGIAHAVLVVYHEGRALLLDNQIDRVVPVETVHHYRPYYSINETHWWLHRAPRQAARRP